LGHGTSHFWSVKHGLRAREGLLLGEDREEFEEHREALMEELNPTGALEVILAAPLRKSARE